MRGYAMRRDSVGVWRASLAAKRSNLEHSPLGTSGDISSMTDDRRDSSVLSGLTAGTIDYVLETRLGLHGYFMSGQVRPVTAATRFCGRARTLRTLPTRPDIVEAQRGGRMANAHRQAIDEIG